MFPADRFLTTCLTSRKGTIVVINQFGSRDPNVEEEEVCLRTRIILEFYYIILKLLLTADGETGAIGAHAVHHVGLGTVSGPGDATVLPRVPRETFVWASIGEQT